MQDRISIILVGPLYSGNLGSVCRAMKNMGLHDLRLVNPLAQKSDPEACKMAVSAKDILEAAQIFPSLAKAAYDRHALIGSSRRLRKDHRDFFSPRQMQDYVAGLHSEEKIALVFGNEESGLANEDLDLCQYVVNIPTSEECASLNLSQAVLILAYELFNIQDHCEPKAKIPADFKSMEGFFTDLESTLEEIEYFEGNPPEHMMRTYRSIFNRAKINKNEVSILRGFLRKLRNTLERSQSSSSQNSVE